MSVRTPPPWQEQTRLKSRRSGAAAKPASSAAGGGAAAEPMGMRFEPSQRLGSVAMAGKAAEPAGNYFEPATSTEPVPSIAEVVLGEAQIFPEVSFGEAKMEIPKSTPKMMDPRAMLEGLSAGPDWMMDRVSKKPPTLEQRIRQHQLLKEKYDRLMKAKPGLLSGLLD